MKFGLSTERNTNPDQRVVLPPNAVIKALQTFPEAEIVVEHSETRAFSDEEYQNSGISVAPDLTDCDVILGIKEVPVANLIPNKSYLFFSHTIKKQQHNREMLRAILDKNITLYDYECVVDAENNRLIGFGYYAGIVGAYNAIRAFGLKFELFKLPKPESLKGKEQLIASLKRITIPPIKFVITGHGRVASGVKEILKAIKVKEVTAENYLTKKYAQPVFTQLNALQYNTRKDGQTKDTADFYQNPEAYESSFEPFTKVSDIYITAHFHDPKAPKILTQEMLNAKDSNLRVVADISCDLHHAIDSTIRTSTFEDPFYGYLPANNTEADLFHPAAIVVMAINNLPSALPIEASSGFAEQFLEYVMPAFFNNDKDGILQRAKIAENGKLTERFSYLQDYVDGN